MSEFLYTPMGGGSEGGGRLPSIKHLKYLSKALSDFSMNLTLRAQIEEASMNLSIAKLT